MQQSPNGTDTTDTDDGPLDPAEYELSLWLRFNLCAYPRGLRGSDWRGYGSDDLIIEGARFDGAWRLKVKEIVGKEPDGFDIVGETFVELTDQHEGADPWTLLSALLGERILSCTTSAMVPEADD